MSWPLSMWGARLRHDGAAAWSWGSAGSSHWFGGYSLAVSSRLRLWIGVGVGGGSGVVGAEEKQRVCLF